MRVAQRMISRNYKRQINSSMSKQSAALERSESGLAFKKLSDNVASGSRAMHLQEQRYASEQQLDNVKNLLAEQKSIDSNLSSIHSLLQKIQESVLKGMSEDWGESSRQVIATDIEKKMEQLLQFANAQYAGHTLFGGTNNSVPPFTVNPDTGKLQFNGIDVDRIFKSAEDGKFYYYDGTADPDHPGNYQYTINGTVTGAFAGPSSFELFGDGTSFHSDKVIGTNPDHEYVEIDGVRYYTENPTHVNSFELTNFDGKSFIKNGKGGFDQVVIDGVEYVKDTVSGYYFEKGVDPSNKPGIVGKVFSSTDGLTFTEMETEFVDAGDGTHIPNVEVKGVKAGGVVKTFSYPSADEDFSRGPQEFKIGADGTYSQVCFDGNNYVLAGHDADGNRIYKAMDPNNKGEIRSADGRTFYFSRDNGGNLVTPSQWITLDLPEMVIDPTPKEVPNSGATFADVGLGLRIKGSDMMADPRTAYQVSFSGLDILGCAGLGYGDPPVHPGNIYGKQNGTQVSGNLYDLLGQIKDALYPDFDKNALDDLYTQLVDLTDNVGMVRTDLGNRMEYLELTETRLDEDIFNMTELESDLISSDPAMEAIKMKECEYVWLALMQLGSKVLPASLLDFMS